MQGLVPGRIVYYVVSEGAAEEIKLRRTKQAQGGNAVAAGDICPAMVMRVWADATGCSNLKVMLDGPDEHWATSVSYEEDKRAGSWHWMFSGQNARYTPDNATPKETTDAAV